MIDGYIFCVIAEIILFLSLLNIIPLYLFSEFDDIADMLLASHMFHIFFNITIAQFFFFESLIDGFSCVLRIFEAEDALFLA